MAGWQIYCFVNCVTFLVFLFLFIVIKRGIYGYAADPGFKITVLIVCADMFKHFQKGVIRYFRSKVIRASVAQSDATHVSIVFPVQLFLRVEIPPFTAIEHFLKLKSFFLLTKKYHELNCLSCC